MMGLEFRSASKNMVDVVFDGKIYVLDKVRLLNAIIKVELWQYQSSSCFGVKLMQLIAKADEVNKRKIFKGFPEEVCAYLMWFYKRAFNKFYKNDEEFFEGVKKELAIKEN